MTAAGPIDIPRAGPTAERDRLATTLFLAAVLHGMLIAGISFTVDGGPTTAPGLEVAPTERGAPDEARDQPAAYIGRSAQRGGGTTRERVAAETPASAPAGEGGAASGGPGTDAAPAASAADAVVGSSATRLRLRLVALPQAALDPRAAGEPLTLPQAGEPLVVATQLSGPALPVAELLRADTAASLIAPYLEAWRTKVERLGTLNYPAIARRLETRISPVLAVELAADGRLLAVAVQRSSGFADVDQAAIEILKLASPFDPFPADLARRDPRLRFAYEWRFDRTPRPGGDTAVPAAYSSP
ncbi:MAG: TonB family protein [Steroidobacteraceae bacterium]